MTKTIYHYNPNTNEYLASSEAIRSPLDKDEVYLIPAFATELEPFLEDGKTTIFENGKWINKVAVEPKLELFTEPTLEELKAQKINQCLSYLASTDWQIIRLSDPTSGESLKEGVAEKRALARSIQNDIETGAINTLEDLNNINFN